MYLVGAVCPSEGDTFLANVEAESSPEQRGLTMFWDLTSQVPVQVIPFLANPPLPDLHPGTASHGGGSGERESLPVLTLSSHLAQEAAICPLRQ